MLSSTAEYALRAVICLAQHPGKALTSGQIAQVTKVPANYLSKVLQELARAELVTSLRGIHGGFTLAVPPEEISILRIVNLVDPIKRIKGCPLKLPTHGGNLCPLHRRIDQAAGVIEQAFASTTVADLLAETNPCPALQEVPAGAGQPTIETSSTGSKP
jgi:Rrf2 family protein